MCNNALTSRAILQTDFSTALCKFAHMDKDQLETVRAVLRRMIEAAGVPDATALAAKAGVAHTTVTRPLSAKSNPDDITWQISARTWMKLSEASGVPVTFLGQRIITPSGDPSSGDPIKQPIDFRVWKFWTNLTNEQRELVSSVIDAWIARQSQ